MGEGYIRSPVLRVLEYLKRGVVKCVTSSLDFFVWGGFLKGWDRVCNFPCVALLLVWERRGRLYVIVVRLRFVFLGYLACNMVVGGSFFLCSVIVCVGWVSVEVVLL